MESLFLESINDEIIKELSKKILKLFSELHGNDSAVTILLVKYLTKQFLIESDTCKSANDVVKSNILVESKFTQTETVESHNGWDMKDITNEVKQVAEQCLNQTGLNYDKTSGMYYNSEEGYYYIPDYRLYYYPRLGAYYYYDEESKTLKFHSSVPSGESISVDTNENVGNTSSKSTESVVKQNIEPPSVKELPRRLLEEKEEGELSSSDEEEEGVISEENPNKVIIESGPKAFVPDHSKHNAPCMRLVVVKTSLENCHTGTLFLITRDGGTLGREGVHHEILLPDNNVSKEHLQFQYVYKGDSEQRYAYEVVDIGSRNGTWVNGKRLSSPHKKSHPEEITHGTIITLGSTTLLCHIHQGMDSCSECQTVETPIIKENTNESLSSKQQHHKQMMQMKQKYQINSLTENENISKGYVDRAKVRRDTVGSSHDSEKTEMASVHVPMNKKNKGYNLLSKMGWKEGDNLGKNASTSLKEPLYVEPKLGKSGFGAME